MGSMKQLKPMVAPGPGGLRGEHLLAVVRGVGSPDAMDELMEYVKTPAAETAVLKIGRFQDLYLAGRLPDWFYQAWGGLSLVALYKDVVELDAVADAAVRPIGMGDTLRKVFHLHGFQRCRQPMADYLFPQQVVLELGGAAKLVHQVRMLEEATPGSVVAKIDIANAFNEIMRAAG